MITLNGLGLVDEFKLYGPWVTFTESNPGNLLGQTVYFDSNQVEYPSGSGPTPFLGNSGSLANFVDPNTGIVSTGGGGVPITSSANIVPVSSNSLGDFLTQLPGFSTLQSIATGTIGGIPNWILLLGVAGFFIMSETSNKGRFGK